MTEVVIHLRIMSKELERERIRLENESRDIKARAIHARRENNIDAYRTYAAELVRFRKQALATDKSRFQILLIISYLKRAQATANAAKSVEKVASILAVLGEAFDASKVIANYDTIARKMEELEIESSLTEDALVSGGSQPTQEEISSAMAEIDAAAGIEEGAASRAKKQAVSEADALEEAIRSLESQLGV